MIRPGRLLCSLMLAPLALAGCAKKEPPGQRVIESTPETPPDPVADAVRLVAKACTVTPAGELRDCKESAEERLKQTEERQGAIPSLTRHCTLLSDQNASVRAIAAVRIGALSFYRALKQDGTPELLGCLTAELKKGRPEADVWQAERVARAATFLATALDKHEDLLDYLDTKAPPPVKRTGFECLFANGRTRVIEPLEKAADSEDPLMRRAIITGFAYVDHLTNDESGKVCPMLQKLTTDKEKDIAGAAALQLARLCIEDRDKVFATVAAQLKKRLVDLSSVNALTTILSSQNPAPTAPQRKKALGLLTRVISTPEPKPCATCARPTGPSVTRLAALRYLRQLEPQAAEKLAKRYKLDAQK